MPLSLITVNIGQPSRRRAKRQFEWLSRRDDDVFVLTETSATAGSQLLADKFAEAGYSVTWPDHASDDLGVMIVSKNATTPDRVSVEMGFLPARATGVVVDTLSGPLRILGAYVPNKDNRSQSSVERKKRWIQEFSATLKATSSDTPVILMGDLNVVERGHVLKYPKEFLEFDYQFYDDLAVQHDLEDFFRRLHPDRTEYTATSDMPIRDFESTTAMVRLRSPQRCRAASTYMQRASAVLT